MPRTCTVCQHQHRAEIDAAIVTGASYRDIARQFHVSKDATARHASEHIAAAVVASQEARDEAHALDVVRQLKTINATAVAILAEARQRKDHDTALKAIDRIHRQLELQAKLLGDLDDRPQINIVTSPEWMELRTLLMRALLPYVEARVAVAQALLAYDGTGGTHDQRSA